MIDASMAGQRDAMIASGWTVASDYGYTHSGGWSIGIYRACGRWITLLWDSTRPYGRFDSPLEAATCHRERTRDDAQRLEEMDDVAA